jgi:hypothetical protein
MPDIRRRSSRATRVTRNTAARVGSCIDQQYAGVGALGEFGGGGCVSSLSLPAVLRGLPIPSEDEIKKIIK